MWKLYKLFSPIFLTIVLCTTSTLDLYSQNTLAKKISSISFHGIEKNNETYLRQFIEAKVGSFVSDSLLLEDVQRLKNIPSVGYAYYELINKESSVQIVYNIEEVKTLVPVVNFGRVKNNTWIQLGFYESNLGGKGSFLSLIYQNRDRGQHGGQLFYRTERIRGSKWGISAALNKAASLEPLYFDAETVNYEYSNYELGFTTFKQFDFRHQLEVGGTYFIERFRKSDTQFFENPTGPNLLRLPKYLSKIELTGNYLNYHYFYLYGAYWQLAYQNVYTISDQTWFQNLQFTGKYFTRIGKDGNLAFRLLAGLGTNNDSPFAPYVIDSHVNFRGVGNRTARGTAQFIINTEYRLTLLDEEKWALQIVTFLDIGTLRSPGEPLKNVLVQSQIQNYFGSGFRLIYKEFYGAVLRVDYGLNIQDITQAGAVIGFGQYF